MPIRSVEEYIKEANEAGWYVINLFQFGVTEWRCNLQRRAENGGTLDLFTEFADGPTPHEAVKAALENARQSRAKPGRVSRGVPPDDKAPKRSPEEAEAAQLRLLLNSDPGKQLQAALAANLKARRG